MRLFFDLELPSVHRISSCVEANYLPFEKKWIIDEKDVLSVSSNLIEPSIFCIVILALISNYLVFVRNWWRRFWRSLWRNFSAIQKWFRFWQEKENCNFLIYLFLNFCIFTQRFSCYSLWKWHWKPWKILQTKKVGNFKQNMTEYFFRIIIWKKYIIMNRFQHTWSRSKNTECDGKPWKFGKTILLSNFWQTNMLLS